MSDATRTESPKPRRDSNSYDAIHYRLKATRGKASDYQCAAPGCDQPAAVWAWQHTGPSRSGISRQGKSVSWGIDVDDYDPACRRHGLMSDHGGTVTHCPNGHSRAETGVNGNKCIECDRESNRVYYAANRDRINARKRAARAEARAALVAALRGGELTREESDRG